MIKHHLIIAYRALTKNLSFSLINIFGLSLSLAVFLIISQFVSFELSYDDFHSQGDQIYRVESQFFKNNELTDDWATSSTGYGMAMKDAYPEILDMTRIWLWNSEKVVQYEDIKYREKNVVAADASFFQMFSFPLLQGDPVHALQEPNTVVISESYRKKYFANTDPIGKTLKLSDVSRTYICEITGVFQDFPVNSHLHYDIIYSWATVASHWKAMDQFWYKHAAYTYIALPSPANADYIEKDFPALAEKYKTLEALKDLTWGVELTPIKDIHLNAWKGKEVEVKGSYRAVWFMRAMALLIMIIAWINYTNLSTIKSIERIKEVGLRKIAGVEKSRLILQFLFESLLLSLLAAVISVFIVLVAELWLGDYLPGLIIPLNFSLESVLILLLMLGAGILISGLYPALVLSSIKPVEGLKGDVKNSLRGNMLRRTLITFQLTGSMILISVTFLIYKQVQFMKTHETGIATDQTIIINAPVSTKNYADDLLNFKHSVLRNSQVKTLTYSSSVPGQEVGMFLSNKRVGEDKNRLYEMLRTDYDYLDTYGLKILKGRNFSRDFPADETAILINQESMESLGFESVDEAMQRHVYLETSNKKFSIIGVLENFHQTSLENPFTPIMVFISPDFSWIPYKYVSIKLHGNDISGVIAQIEDVWEQYFPQSPMDYYFLDEFFGRQYAKEESYGKVFIFSSLFAIFISCLGLFGLTYYLIVLKRREIGIRRVLGASTGSLLGHFSRNYVYLILISFVVATPISYLILENWLQNYNFRTDLNLLVFLTPMFILIPIILLTTGSVTLKEVVTNPISSLRHE
ncbi:ABC transporter permease [Fulvivirgaceae bacterium BMA12]|uniref:ABC transporter permease n=1 Tax=Agaribacillus aureus TaxID=3051825 RepID=A0ABT8LB31_9BACT|nr:ABC transporter permease [Fulvivirgaceae bacterium BMA12]